MMETDAQPGKQTNERAGLKAPAIVLVEPQLGENIGFAARAMGNFGLHDLRLVAPRDGWPNEKAYAAAAVAEPIASSARVFGTVEEALADRNYVIATTARPREMTKPVFSPETAAVAIRKRTLLDERCAVMFGAERNGLDNDSIALADAILTAPVDPHFASLSLPQAVLLFSYEWMKTGEPTALGRATSFDGSGALRDLRRPVPGQRVERHCSVCSNIWKARSMPPAFFALPKSAQRWYALFGTCSIAWSARTKMCGRGAESSRP